RSHDGTSFVRLQIQVSPGCAGRQAQSRAGSRTSLAATMNHGPASTGGQTMMMQPRLAALLALALPLAPQLASRAAAPPGKAWKRLCDGKTLSGWKAVEYAGGGKVHVKDGALLLEKGKRMTGAVYTRGDFPKMDYEVTLEGKRVAGGDFFCTTTFPAGDSFCSLVVGGWRGSVVGISSINGADASENETTRFRQFKTGRWYRIHIRVSRQWIEAWIDGQKLVDVPTTGRKITTRIECRACQPFGLATFDTIGAVRDVRVRALGAAEKRALAQRKVPEN